MEVHPIGVVRSFRIDPVDDDWGDVVSQIDLDPGQLACDALAGLEETSVSPGAGAA